MRLAFLSSFECIFGFFRLSFDAIYGVGIYCNGDLVSCVHVDECQLLYRISVCCSVCVGLHCSVGPELVRMAPSTLCLCIFMACCLSQDRII